MVQFQIIISKLFRDILITRNRSVTKENSSPPNLMDDHLGIQVIHILNLKSKDNKNLFWDRLTDEQTDRFESKVSCI